LLAGTLSFGGKAGPTTLLYRNIVVDVNKWPL